jgi:predicted DNA-binding transcriptional regulator YafY
MERLIRLAMVLRERGRVGVPAEDLVELAGFAGGKDAASQLNREFRHLRDLGWKIENIAPQGSSAVFRMTSVDNRLRLKLTPAQQAALQRAVLLADRADLAERLDLAADARSAEVAAVVPASAHDERLGAVIRAVRMRCRLHFTYNGSRRTVHPDSVRAQNGTWYLRAFEDASAMTKVFVVSRMTEVEAENPGTARTFPRERHSGLHPMTWKVDPPVDVTLRTTPEYVDDVRRWLGPPVTVKSVGDEVELVYVVTNRAALRARVYQLGVRVRVVGPDDVRAEILAELAEMAGE